ncbi:MAG: imidazolonepropionase [Bacteroidota bacterium]|nr:imidazolonepropionase [Bacteroidota bacterium]
MSATLIKNIGILAGIGDPSAPLRGAALAQLEQLSNAWLLVEDDTIAGYGPMDTCPGAPTAVDAAGCMLLPAWCDSHTHLVFAAGREHEFRDKLAGVSYAEIAARGGGIQASASAVQAATEEMLFTGAWTRLEEISKTGTGAVEIKSGYGLTVEAELKMLRVIKKLRERSSLLIKSTFLGAHSIPAIYRHDTEGYIREIIEEMLPVIAAERLADYIDVFCEEGFFNPDQTARICRAGIDYGLKPKIHANQLNVSGGVQTGVAVGAVSVDHLESMDDAAIASLAGASTIGCMLPGAAFFLRMPYPPAREMIAANCALALGSDFNPGSCPTGNIPLLLSLACVNMRMMPEEAINAVTINGAFAMGVNKEAGSIAVGKNANLILTRPMPAISSIPYYFGSNPADRVMLRGQWQ